MRIKSFKVKTITLKLLVPISLIIMLSITGLGIFAYTQERGILTDSIAAEAAGGLDTLINTMKNSNASISAVKNELLANYIAKARLVAHLISRDNGLLSTDNLNSLAKETGVDEIHVVDENGILNWSSIPEVIGYDMESSEQSKEFLTLINDKSKAIAQEPQQRGADKTLFQYVGVSSIDKPGIVQIGVRPESVQKLNDILSVEQDIKSLKLSKTGYYFVLDKDGVTLYHPTHENIGLDVKQFDWGQRILKDKSGDFTYKYDGVEKHLFFKEAGDGMFVCATIPTADYLAPLNRLKSDITLTVLIAILISILIIYLLSLL